MAKTDSTIQVRIDAKLKKDSSKVLDAIGLDMSSAVKILLKNIVMTGSFPLELRTENGYTVQQELEILKEIEYTRKHGKVYASAAELFADLNGAESTKESLPRKTKDKAKSTRGYAIRA